MILQCELAVGALEFYFSDRAAHAQHFVVIAFCVRRQKINLSSETKIQAVCRAGRWHKPA
jgi:hypothetical protein